jgi:hypothetical protein
VNAGGCCGRASADVFVFEGKLSMGHVTRDTSRADIDIDTTTGQIFFQQRWQYVWMVAPGLPAWTLAEQRRFHRRADLMVWNIWSNRAAYRVAGSSEFARRFAHRELPVNFDIDWVLSRPQWVVRVTKVPLGTMTHNTRVEWNERIIHLCTEDFETTRHAGGIVAHEFGHSMGNTYVLNRGDEYKPTSPNHHDSASVLNVGRTLRTRHFQTMIEELNKMIPNTTWSVASLK